jgi:hypothetical protein
MPDGDDVDRILRALLAEDCGYHPDAVNEHATHTPCAVCQPTRRRAAIAARALRPDHTQRPGDPDA